MLEKIAQTRRVSLMMGKKLQSLNEIIVGTAQPETAKLLLRLKREG